MRFRSRRSGESDNFWPGFVSGLLFAGLTVGSVRFLQWASNNSVVQEIRMWATTTQIEIAPVDLLQLLIPVLLALAIAYIAHRVMPRQNGWSK